MTVPPTSTPLRAAGPDRRFHALVLDRLLVWGLGALAGATVWWLTGDGVAVALAVLLGVVVLALLLAVPLGVRGTTPGKAVAGLRVVHASTGAPIGVGPALLRTAVLGVAGLPTFGLGLATLAWTAVADGSGRRRGAHDVLSHAVVVDVRPVPDVVEEVPAAPREIVNLTALRLLPTPAPGRQAPTPAPPPPVADPTADPTAVQVPATPARWRVTADTGESFVVAGPALLGRCPEPSPGEPVDHLLPLHSGDMSLSKTHAQLQVAPDGVLVVMDRGSTNGTVLLRQGALRPLSAGRPTTLVDGDRVRLGDRELTVAREGRADPAGTVARRAGDGGPTVRP